MNSENQYSIDRSPEMEARRVAFKEDVLERIRSGGEIGMYAGYPVGHGDNLYTHWASAYVLSLAAAVPIEDIHFTSFLSRNDIHTDTLLFAEDAYGLARDAGYPIIDQVTDSLLTYFSYVMDVQLPENAFRMAPQPLHVDAGPLATFDKEAIVTRGEALRQETAGKKRIVIVSAGDYPEKRFSEDQSKELEIFLHTDYPDAFIETLSDAGFADGSIDINEVSAHMYASDMLITTDTFWGWVGAGSRAMRNDRNGILQPRDIFVLYTMADAHVYGIPGAEHIISPAVEYYRGNETALRGTLSRADYFKYFYAMHQDMPLTDEYRFTTPEATNSYRRAVHTKGRGIDELDIDLLKARLVAAV